MLPATKKKASDKSEAFLFSRLSLKLFIFVVLNYSTEYKLNPTYSAPAFFTL